MSSSLAGQIIAATIAVNATLEILGADEGVWRIVQIANAVVFTAGVLVWLALLARRRIARRA